MSANFFMLKTFSYGFCILFFFFVNVNIFAKGSLYIRVRETLFYHPEKQFIWRKIPNLLCYSMIVINLFSVLYSTFWILFNFMLPGVLFQCGLRLNISHGHLFMFQYILNYNNIYMCGFINLVAKKISIWKKSQLEI